MPSGIFCLLWLNVSALQVVEKPWKIPIDFGGPTCLFQHPVNKLSPKSRFATKAGEKMQLNRSKRRVTES